MLGFPLLKRLSSLLVTCESSPWAVERFSAKDLFSHKKSLTDFVEVDMTRHPRYQVHRPFNGSCVDTHRPIFNLAKKRSTCNFRLVRTRTRLERDRMFPCVRLISAMIENKLIFHLDHA